MKYLSFDIEATGLEEHDYIIEFACVPFDTDLGMKGIAEDLTFHHFVQCPPFHELKDKLNPWVIKHNKELIEKASSEGLTLKEFKASFTEYLESDAIGNYFSMGGKKSPITLFGKSMAAIDLPFLNRDLGWEYMRHHFSHRQLDLSAIAYGLVDMKLLPPECTSGSFLMNHLGFGDVAHTALEDAINTAKMYLKILELPQA